jgi:hypothetical protein
MTPQQQMFIAIISSSAVTGLILKLIEYIISLFSKKKNANDCDHEKFRASIDALVSQISGLTYASLSDKIEKLLDQGYATPDQRQDLKTIVKIYKEQGWNGDMNARLKRVYDSPTKQLFDRRKEDRKNENNI